MYVQSRVIEHLFEEWSKFKKKKKEKKMTSNGRTSKFEYFLQGNFKWFDGKQHNFHSTLIVFFQLRVPKNIRSYDDVSCPRYNNFTKEIP